MKYRYLQERGALNETGAGPGPVVVPTSHDGTTGARWRGRRIPPEVIRLVPESLAREGRVVAVESRGETVVCAAADPGDIALADKLAFVLARRIELVPADRDEVARLIEEGYGPHRGEDDEDESVDSMLQDFSERTIDVPSPAPPQAPSLSAARRLRAVDRRGEVTRTQAPPPPRPSYANLPPGLDPSSPVGVSGVFRHVVEESQRVL